MATCLHIAGGSVYDITPGHPQCHPTTDCWPRRPIDRHLFTSPSRGCPSPVDDRGRVPWTSVCVFAAAIATISVCTCIPVVLEINGNSITTHVCCSLAVSDTTILAGQQLSEILPSRTHARTRARTRSRTQVYRTLQFKVSFRDCPYFNYKCWVTILRSSIF